MTTMSKFAERITIDIETIPDQREGAAQAARSRIKAPANYKDPEKIEAYIEARAQEAWLATSLDGSYGQVYCIGYAFDDEDAKVIWDDGLTLPGERDLLQRFWENVEERLTLGSPWIGHNVQRFDLRFLWKRSVIHGVAPASAVPFTASPFSDAIQDTMMMWTGDRNTFISLDELLGILGVDSEDFTDGSAVWDHIQNDEHEIVLHHCLRNVEETREAWRRMTFAPAL